MVKADIINKIISEAEIEKKYIVSGVNNIIEIMRETLKTGEKIELRGFGVFKVVAKKTGIGRNLQNNTPLELKEGKRIKFKSGKNLKKI
ncbi:MAG: HU family DNA-binding protein [Acidobacteriota bacterium]